jgi:hypothetical protein
MENGDKCVDKKQTTLNSILTQLSNAVGITGRNADRLEDKINKLDLLNLESSKKLELKTIDKSDTNADTHLYNLKALVTRLEISNQKNAEILDKLDELI